MNETLEQWMQLGVSDPNIPLGCALKPWTQLWSFRFE